MSRRANRRQFLKNTALVGVGVWVAGSTLARPSRAAIETVNFACIGVGGKGDSDTADAARHGNVVAICDVDENTLNKAAAKYSQAKKYYDFRKMLEEMGKTIDAVTVSTPDHMHAPAGLMAMRLGKHCFVQKPMTRTVYEARLMGKVARENNVATQMGNQGTAGAGLRKAAAIVKAGGIGPVTEVHVWTNRPIWPQGLDRPSDTPPVPSTLHWEEWLGVAPSRPYHSAYHPFKWRGWWAFGTGALGDMACHTLNLPFMACDLRDPISIQAQTSGHNGETFPKDSVIVYQFAAIEHRPACTFTWYDGGQRPDAALLQGEKMNGSGALMIGEKGALYAPGDYAGNFVLLPKGTAEPDVDYPKSPGHFTEWVNAIKGGPPAMSNFPDYASALTETVVLGNLAVWSGKKVEWDAKNLKAVGAPELDEIVKPSYRPGYTLDT
jgi:predicted dehydrogenase